MSLNNVHSLPSPASLDLTFDVIWGNFVKVTCYLLNNKAKKYLSTKIVFSSSCCFFPSISAVESQQVICSFGFEWNMQVHLDRLPENGNLSGQVVVLHLQSLEMCFHLHKISVRPHLYILSWLFNCATFLTNSKVMLSKKSTGKHKTSPERFLNEPDYLDIISQ